MSSEVPKGNWGCLVLQDLLSEDQFFGAFHELFSNLLIACVWEKKKPDIHSKAKIRWLSSECILRFTERDGIDNGPFERGLLKILYSSVENCKIVEIGYILLNFKDF